MAEALASLDGAEIVAVGSRTQDAADEFAERHSIPRAHGSYDELWADPNVDVIYIGSPHSEHHWMTLAALDGGKHVLCEKAFAINAGEAREMIDAARRSERFLMEAMWSWFMPAWHELRHRIADGAIGDVISIDANFAIPVLDEDGRHRRPELAGGALLDLGIYPLSIGRFLLGEAVEVKALGHLTSQGVDGSGRWGDAPRVGGDHDLHDLTRCDVRPHRSDRRNRGHRSGCSAVLVSDRVHDHPPRRLRTRSGSKRPNRGLAHEAEHVMERIRAGAIESDVQTWAATMANMELMDEIRRQLGVVYPSETTSG